MIRAIINNQNKSGGPFTPPTKSFSTIFAESICKSLGDKQS